MSSDLSNVFFTSHYIYVFLKKMSAINIFQNYIWTQILLTFPGKLVLSILDSNKIEAYPTLSEDTKQLLLLIDVGCTANQWMAPITFLSFTLTIFNCTISVSVLCEYLKNVNFPFLQSNRYNLYYKFFCKLLIICY